MHKNLLDICLKYVNHLKQKKNGQIKFSSGVSQSITSLWW